MNDQIQEIAQRLRGLRDALNISIREIAEVCHVSEDEYLEYESGNNDIPVSILQNISKRFNVELTDLLFGESPKMTSFYLTRAGLGTAMERSKSYKYQSLAAGFLHRKADPFIVTVEPKPEGTPMHLNTHEGSLLLSINGKELILNKGDSLYFNAENKHGMKALNGESAKFLAVII